MIHSLALQFLWLFRTQTKSSESSCVFPIDISIQGLQYILLHSHHSQFAAVNQDSQMGFSSERMRCIYCMYKNYNKDDSNSCENIQLRVRERVEREGREISQFDRMLGSDIFVCFSFLATRIAVYLTCAYLLIFTLLRGNVENKSFSWHSKYVVSIYVCIFEYLLSAYLHIPHRHCNNMYVFCSICHINNENVYFFTSAQLASRQGAACEHISSNNIQRYSVRCIWC